MEIEDFTQDDLDVLNLLKPADWGDIRPWHEFYLSKPFCFPKKAVVDGTIAGIGTGIKHQGSGWLAHIIVAAEFRKRGIGGEIVRALIGLLEGDHGCRTISLIATDLGYPVYCRAGFEVQTEYVFYSRTGDAGKGDAAGPNVRPYEPIWESAVFDLDRQISGENRSQIIAEQLHSSLVYVRDGEVTGYYLPNLGEGPVLTADAEAGKELLKEKMKKAMVITLPAGNSEGRKFLVENGFRETNIARRMVYGQPFAWKPDGVFSRIGGNLG